MKVQAAVIREPGADFLLEEVFLDDPRPDEVLVRVCAVGICHTDVAVRDRHLSTPLPAVLGHEGSGIVARVGGDVDGLKVGDPVVMTFSSCGTCRQCRSGHPSYCESFRARNSGARRADGTCTIHDHRGEISSPFFGQSSFARFAVATARNTVRVPHDLPLKMLGPLGCGIQTGAGSVLNVFRCRPDTSILIAGGGSVGFGALMAAVIAGCSTIVVSEPLAARRRLATELGATHVLDPAEGGLVESLRSILPAGVDYALDTTGRSDVIAASIEALAIRGTLGLVGVPSASDGAFSVPTIPFMAGGKTVVGIVEGDADPATFIPEMIRYHREGRFPIDRLMRFYPFDQINRAIRDQSAGDCVKPVLVMDDQIETAGPSPA